MKTTQAWVWLAAGVLALGLNGIYQDGGAAWAHRIADGAIERVAHRSQGLVDLAAERVDRFVEGANLVAVRDETASCRLAAAMARIEARAARVRMVPVAFNAVEIPMVVCPRVRASAPRVSVPRLPVVRIPAPAVHVEMVGAGPV